MSCPQPSPAMPDPDPSGPSPAERRLAACEEAVGWRFRDPVLLRKALTHASATSDRLSSNERLEFLGDAVLEIVVCESLFRSRPDLNEGALTAIKSIAVSRESLARAAERLGLGECLILGRGMTGRLPLPDSVLADVFEAVAAALYLDAGLEEVRTFILRALGEALRSAVDEAMAGNYKSVLQEAEQQAGRPAPRYEVTEETGPDHAKRFVVEVRQDRTVLGTGEGSSKKEAEQDAARAALERLGHD